MITVLYGSETGNAQDYAALLARRLKYCQLKPVLAPLDQYPLKKLITETTHLIIVCSTTGQGQLPRNAQKFMNFIRKKKLPDDFLNHIKLTSFGLGDSLYPKFNYAIRKIHNRLLQLGCSEFLPRCESDEMAPEGVDAFYTEWEALVLEGLEQDFPFIQLDGHALLKAENKVILDENSDDVLEFNNQDLITSRNTLSHGKIVQNDRITDSTHFQDVRHVIIESENFISYEVGDTVALYPWNDDATVDLLFEAQPHWAPFANKLVSIVGEFHVQGGLLPNLTLWQLFKYHLDIMSIPRRSFFSILWHFCDSSTEDGEREQEKLREFSGFEDPEELYNYANRPRRLILETILEFQGNVKIPISYIFDLFPKIHARLFLIALKPNLHRIEIVVAIVEYKTILKRIRKGLCTKWLKLQKPGSLISFSTHASRLEFPLKPVIMISPGTGVAPMKSLIEDKAGKQDLYLFYGCRYRAKDCLFDQKWLDLEKKGQLHYFPCFSRDEGSQYKYVQDKLFSEKELIKKLILDQEATIFVCGSSGRMPREVRLTIVEILTQSGLTNEQANEYLVEMERKERYIQETW